MKKTKKISYATLSGASVISDPDRHPYLAQLCDAITKRGGKYMDEAIETAKIEYNKKYQFFYPKGSMPIFFVYSVLDTEKWIAIERLYRGIVETFNETKHIIVNNIKDNAERAALADVLYRILKDRIFWDEIMLLKMIEIQQSHSKKLSESDRDYLESIGVSKYDFAQIEDAISVAQFYVYQIKDGENISTKDMNIKDYQKVNFEKAVDLLGRETVLSAMSRAAFHWNAGRTANGYDLYVKIPAKFFLGSLKMNPADLSGIKSAAKTIAKNVKNAFKNLSLPEITNNSGYEIDDIPETLSDRKAMLERMLVPLIGTKKYCTGLRDFAEITGGSVPEICYHASKNKASTLAALCLLDVIAAAKYIPPPTPPHGSTQAKRHISEMYELRCKIKGLGVVKLTIGKRAYNSDMVYCITKFRFDKITKK